MRLYDHFDEYLMRMLLVLRVVCAVFILLQLIRLKAQIRKQNSLSRCPMNGLTSIWVIFQHSGFGQKRKKLIAKLAAEKKWAATTQASRIHQSNDVRIDIIELLAQQSFHSANKMKTLS